VRILPCLLLCAGLVSAQNPAPLQLQGVGDRAVFLRLQVEGGGKPLRVRVLPRGGKAVVVRVQVEGGGGDGGGGKPDPADKLAADLADLYAKDADPDKATHAQALAGLYGWAAEALGGEDYPTAGDFREALGKKSGDALPADVLLPLRRRVQEELRGVLPLKASAPLGADTRQKAAKLFGRLAKVMAEVAK
jgi:hypothetical protein